MKEVFTKNLVDRGIRYIKAPITHPSSMGLAKVNMRLVLG